MGVVISVLGPVTIVRDDERVDPGPRQRRLLAGLAVASGDTVSSDKLVDITWGEKPPAAASRSLKTYVTRLRQSLVADGNTVDGNTVDGNTVDGNTVDGNTVTDGDDPIPFHSDGYRLDPALVSIDADQFETDAAEAERRLRIGDDEAALELVQRALGAWHGSALGDLADEDWARPAAVRLEERRLETRATLVRALIANEMTSRAVGEARALVDSEPHREGPAEVLMLALHADGRTAEAMRVVPELRSRLADSVGLEPSPSLREVEQRIAIGAVSRRPLGRSLRGYELHERIGEGTQALVHRATQTALDREVAVKIIRPELADQPDFIRRFEHEAHLVARVEHPHVVPLHDFWREPGAAYLVMRYMRGGSVEELLRRRGGLSTTQVASLIEQVGGALARAHQRGVVHRDIRPANLLLDDDGAGFLADFGIARLTGDGDPLSVLSPVHAAPEVLRGAAAGRPADIHALGVTVFEMLTGRSPFSDTNDRAELIRRHLQEPLPSVTALRPDVSPAIDGVLGRATAKDPSERPERVEELVADLIEALDRSDRAAGVPTPGTTGSIDPGAAPYVGLHRFDEADADRFFGRGDATDDVVGTLRQQPFVTVAGPSGSGKSSVVRAGVLPQIRRGALNGSQEWFVSTMVPGDSPFEALEAALLRVAVNPPASLAGAMTELHGVARMIRRCLPADDSVLLLVIDQFEELFTLGNRATSIEFIDQLCAAVTGSDRLRVITTIRADHLDGPLELHALAELLREGLVTTGPMSTEGLERAITEPARRAGVLVEPALVAELVNESIDRPSALPLLQYTLTQLWERRTSGVMTLESYRRLGGLGAAIGDRAESLVPTESDQAAARRLFSRLVTVPDAGEATRRRALRSEFGDDPSTLACVEAFGAARLLSFDHDMTSHEPIVEVAHEALLTSWQRLASWVEDDREDLALLRRVTEASRTWQAGGRAPGDRDPGDLARGVFLERTRNLLRDRPELASDLERTWFDASDDADRQARAAEAEAAAHQARMNARLRRLLALAAGLLAVAAVASIVAVVQRSTAIETADAADIDRLVAQSAAELTEAPDRAMLLAVEAHRRSPTAATRGAILRAIDHNPAILSIRPVPLDGATNLALAAGGVRAVSWSTDPTGGHWTIVDQVTGAAIEPSGSHPNGINTAAISGDGSTVVLAPNGGQLLVIGGDGRGAIDFDERVRTLRVDGTGTRVLVTTTSSALLIDLATGTERWRYDAAVEEVMCGECAAITDDGETIALGLADVNSNNLEESVLALFDTDGNEVRRISDHSAVIVASFARDGGLLYSGGIDGRIVVHDVAGEEPARAVSISNDLVRALESNENGVLTVAALDGRITTLDPDLRQISVVELNDIPGSVVIDDNDTVTVSFQDGSTMRLDPARTTLGVDTHEADFSHVPPFGTYFDTPNEDFTETIVHRLDTGEEVSRVGFGEAILGYGRYADWSTDGEWLYTYDQGSEAIAIGEVFGDARYVHDLNDLSFQLRGTGYIDASNAAVRLGERGRTFVFLGEPGNAAAGWFDPATGDLVAGPLPLDQPVPALILRDGAVVIGDHSSPLLWLPPNLDSDPRTLFDDPGLRPLDEHPDGRILAGGATGEIALIDPVTGDRTVLIGSEGAVESATINADGTLAVVMQGESIAVFDLDTDTLIGRPIGIELSGNSVLDMSWSDDGRSVWYDSARGPTRIDLDPETWVERACTIAGRALTAEEWRTFVSPDSDPVDACT